MLKIKTEIKNSPIHGIGLFALQDVAKGELIWELNTQFDKLFSPDNLAELPELTQNYITHYSYFDKTLNLIVLCSDNARFFNRSENSNCGGEQHDKTIALRDIKEGEELTEIYYNLKEIESQKLGSISI
jgi:SET domain-containing protein